MTSSLAASNISTDSEVKRARNPSNKISRNTQTSNIDIPPNNGIVNGSKCIMYL